MKQFVFFALLDAFLSKLIYCLLSSLLSSLLNLVCYLVVHGLCSRHWGDLAILIVVLILKFVI